MTYMHVLCHNLSFRVFSVAFSISQAWHLCQRWAEELPVVRRGVMSLMVGGYMGHIGRGREE